MTLSGIICSLFELNCPYGVSKSAFISLSLSLVRRACMRVCAVRLRAHIPFSANALSSAQQIVSHRIHQIVCVSIMCECVCVRIQTAIILKFSSE